MFSFLVSTPVTREALERISRYRKNVPQCLENVRNLKLSSDKHEIFGEVHAETETIIHAGRGKAV